MLKTFINDRSMKRGEKGVRKSIFRNYDSVH